MAPKRDAVAKLRAFVGLIETAIGRSSSAFALLVLLLVSSQARAQDNQLPSVSDLKRNLSQDYQMTDIDIAAALTKSGENNDGKNSDPRLIRWSSGPSNIVILGTGDTKAEALRLVQAIDNTMAGIAKHGTYCAEGLNIATDGTYSPSITSAHCLQNPYDFLIVIDSSAIIPRSLFQDLHARSQILEDRDDWERRANAEATFFDKTSCQVELKIDQRTSSFGPGTAYFRVAGTGTDNLRLLDECEHALPFLILGLKPQRLADSRLMYIKELLQLYYSPQLRDGMTRAEILSVLSDQK